MPVRFPRETLWSCKLSERGVICYWLSHWHCWRIPSGLPCCDEWWRQLGNRSPPPPRTFNSKDTSPGRKWRLPLSAKHCQAWRWGSEPKKPPWWAGMQCAHPHWQLCLPKNSGAACSAVGWIQSSIMTQMESLKTDKLPIWVLRMQIEHPLLPVGSKKKMPICVFTQQAIMTLKKLVHMRK